MKVKGVQRKDTQDTSAEWETGVNVTLCIHDANLHLGERVLTQRRLEEVYIIFLGGAHLQSFGRVLALYWGVFTWDT